MTLGQSVGRVCPERLPKSSAGFVILWIRARGFHICSACWFDRTNRMLTWLQRICYHAKKSVCGEVAEVTYVLYLLPYRNHLALAWTSGWVSKTRYQRHQRAFAQVANNTKREYVSPFHGALAQLPWKQKWLSERIKLFWSTSISDCKSRNHMTVGQRIQS